MLYLKKTSPVLKVMCHLDDDKNRLIGGKAQNIRNITMIYKSIRNILSIVLWRESVETNYPPAIDYWFQ